MRTIPEFTDQDKAKLDRALDRIAAGVSVYRTYGHPCKPKTKKWNMDGLIGGFPTISHALTTHPQIFTTP